MCLYIMGNSKSTLKGGSKTVQTLQYTDIQKKLQDIMDSVLHKHQTEITNKTYCKRLKVFMTNDILMKYSTDSLQKVSKNIFIGVEQDLDSDMVDAKENLCKRLSELYIRKLNLIASIHIMLDICYKRIYAMKKGNRCVSEGDPFRISKISVLESDNLKEIENNKYNISSKKVKHDDSTTDDTIGVTKELLRDQWIDKLKLKHKDIHNSAKDYVFVSELFKEKDCVSQKGKWIDHKSDLVKLKLKPDPALKEYNKRWKSLMREMENKFNEEALQLLLICDTLVEEKMVTNDDGTTSKTYTDKEVDDRLLNDLIKRTKPKLIFLYSYISDRYLTMTHLPIITQTDVDKGKEIRQKYEEMKKKLHSG
jgi:hypothetical protein